MKLKEQVKPSCHLWEGKHSAAIFGGTVKKNIGYKSLLAALIGIFALCSAIAVGCFALIKSVDALRAAAKNHPKEMKIFALAVAALVKVYAFLTAEE